MGLGECCRGSHGVGRQTIVDGIAMGLGKCCMSSFDLFLVSKLISKLPNIIDLVKVKNKNT